MGESALRSQVKGEGHKKQEKVMSQTFVKFFVKGETKVKKETATTTSTSGDSLMVIPQPTIAGPVASSSISNYVSKNDVLKAEIIWTMQTVMKHASYKSNENINKIF